MTIASRIVLRTALAAVFVFLGVSGRAQTVRDSATTTDLKFHQFQPAVAPEKAASSTAAQLPGPNGMSLGAAQQIQALQQEKESRTPAQRKIDSNVLYTLRMLQGRPAAPGVPFLYTGIDLDENNNIVVDITANVGDSLLQQLSSAGALIFYTNAGLRSVRASIPPSQIESIAASPDVIFISPKQGWATHRVAPSLKSHTLLNRPMAPGFELREARVRKQLALAMQSVTSGTGQGSVTTEGDATHRAFDARGTFGINGAGLKIGVLSDGVTSLAQSQATGDLGTVTVLPGQTGAGDEGTAMLEIIHDMAPGASLFFATADNGITSFAQNIRDLRTAGCDIIVDDVFYFVETPFQDGQTGTVISNTNGGVVTQAVNDVVTAGALYFSSAGNEGSVDESTSGTFEGDFVPVAAGAPLPAGNVNNFGGGTVFDVINSPGLGFIGLWWADPLGGSANDYDLYILNSTSTAILASSTNIQNGAQDPFESVSAGIAPGNRVVVFQKTGAANRFFHVGNLRGTLAINTTGETHGHSAASGAYTVAATPAAATPFGGPPGPFPNPFNATNVVETFSSDGLRRIFFNGDSTPITPGNFSSTGGAVLNKPDVTGADGVSVTGVGGFGSPFFGTSAAAPSAAAVAALVKSAKPTLTQAQIRTALTSTAVDIMGAGFDRDSGAGIVMAWEAVNSLGVPGAANPELGTVTATENPGNGNGSLEAGEGGKVVIQLKNTSGVVAATGITAVLTSSTPGVIITQPNTTTYADLPAGTGVGINVSPLTFTLASNFGCGLNIDFTLTVTYTGGTTPSRALAFSVPTGLMTSFNNNLGTKPTAITGITTATGTQVNRISRNGVVSACGSVKLFPGVITNPSLTFDSYTFTACQSTCAKATLTSAGGINLFESAYSPSYDPANIGTNFKGDAGLSGTTQIFSIDLTSATAYTLVVNDVTGTSVGTNYTLQFPSCAFNCSGINQLPVAVVQNVTVVSAVPGGSANASIDNGSFDPDDATNTLTFTQTPPGPYPHGTTTVMLTVTDPKGAAAQASATVTVIDPSPNPDLTVAKTHSGNFAQGQVGATYTITVSNVGALPTVGTATMTDILPASLTPTAASGTGWTCGIVTQTVTCTRSDALAAVSSYPAITLTVTVATNAPASVTNTANVTGGGEVNLGNDSSSNPTTITPVDNFSFNPTLPSVSVTAGQSVTEHITFTPTPSTGSTINFSCSNLPPLTSCSFSPASVPPSTTPVDIAMTITTTATTTAALQRPRVFYAAWVPLSSLGLVGIVLVGTRRRNRKKVVGLAALSLVLGLLLVNGCGGSKHVPVTNPGTPPGSYTITTTATSPNVTKSTTFTLVVN